MADDISKLTATIYDHGNNVALAERLTREFGTVNYFAPWQKSSPETLDKVVGDGLKNVNRVLHFFDPDVLHHTDLFIFPDIYCGDLQRDLISRGKLVWGSGMSEGLEFKRSLFAETLKEVSLPVSPYKVCVGMTELREYLKENEDQWIKVGMRGDGETWHHDNYTLSARKLESMDYLYGAVKELVRFTVCETIPTSLELAYDGFMVTSPGGKPQFPSIGFLGCEVKNRAHIIHAIDYDDFPDEVREINDKFAPKLAEKFFRSPFGTEIKVGDDGKNYFLDATLRCTGAAGFNHFGAGQEPWGFHVCRGEGGTA